MASTYTTNYGFEKPDPEADINVNPINTDLGLIDTEINNTQKSVAIISKGNTHGAIASGEYVYVYGHSTLTNGLYKATSAVSANGTLSLSNLSAISKGGLNDLLDVLNTKANRKTIQSYVFQQLASDGTPNANGISEIPTTPGVYRVTSAITGLPSGAEGYGTLIVFNCGGYMLYIYVDVNNNFYYSKVSSVAAPSVWYGLPRTYKKEISGTTTSSGSISAGINIANYTILECRRKDTTGFAFSRGDGYVICFGPTMNLLANTSVTVEVIYTKQSMMYVAT